MVWITSLSLLRELDKDTLIFTKNFDFLNKVQYKELIYIHVFILHVIPQFVLKDSIKPLTISFILYSSG